MTRRGGKEASVRSRGIGEDEWQPPAGDGATGRSVEAFQFGDIGSA